MVSLGLLLALTLPAQAPAAQAPMAQAPQAPSGTRVVFLPNDARHPVLVVRTDVTASGPVGSSSGGVRRTAEVLLLRGHESVARTFEDIAAAPAPFGQALPPLPRQLQLVDDGEGGLLLTLSDLDDWQRDLGATPSPRDRSSMPAVASKETARLWLSQGAAPAMAGEPWAGRAVLFGTDTRIEGTASLEPGAPGGAVLVGGGGGSEALGSDGFVVDVQAACGRVIPRIVLGPYKDGERSRVTLDSPQCLQSGQVAARVVGVREGGRRPVELSGLYLSDRQAPAPR